MLVHVGPGALHVPPGVRVSAADWWDLSDDELVARLEQRGVDRVRAFYLAENRDNFVATINDTLEWG